MEKILKARIEELISLYKDSPGVTVTYIDLARILSLILEIDSQRPQIGFKQTDV